MYVGAVHHTTPLFTKREILTSARRREKENKIFYCVPLIRTRVRIVCSNNGPSGGDCSHGYRIQSHRLSTTLSNLAFNIGRSPSNCELFNNCDEVGIDKREVELYLESIFDNLRQAGLKQYDLGCIRLFHCIGFVEEAGEFGDINGERVYILAEAI